jgi:hypothetical protein
MEFLAFPRQPRLFFSRVLTASKPHLRGARLWTPVRKPDGHKVSEAARDEHSIGGGGEYCGDSNAQLGSINLYFHEASGGKCVSRAMLMDL